MSPRNTPKSARLPSPCGGQAASSLSPVGELANPSPVTGAAPSSRAALGRGRATSPVGGAGASTASSAGSTAIAAAMSEAQLEEHVRALCKDLGILRFHVKDSRGTNAGLPDDILVGAGGVLWRECKTQKGKLTPAQWAAANALNLAGQDWNTWRPSDLLDGTIARELTAISGFGTGVA